MYCVMYNLIVIVTLLVYSKSFIQLFLYIQYLIKANTGIAMYFLKLYYHLLKTTTLSIDISLIIAVNNLITF